jgi:hypothetical protein
MSQEPFVDTSLALLLLLLQLGMLTWLMADPANPPPM